MTQHQPTPLGKSIQDILQEGFLLVSFSATSGPRTKTDRRASADLTDGKRAKRGSAKAVKDLWFGASREVDAIDSAIGRARSVHYELTAAFSAGSGDTRRRGDRLLSNYDLMREGGYAQTMSKAKQDIAKELHKFQQVYDIRVQQAMAALGDMAVRSDYPSFDEYKNACTLVFRPKPIPTGDAWSKSSLMMESVSQKLIEITEADLQQKVDCAIQDAVGRIHEPLMRMVNATTLNEKQKYPRLFDSVVDNMSMVAKCLRAFNLYNNPEISKVADEIEQRLLRFTPDQLRANENNKAVLNKDALDVQRMVEAMGSFAAQ